MEISEVQIRRTGETAEGFLASEPIPLPWLKM